MRQRMRIEMPQYEATLKVRFTADSIENAGKELWCVKMDSANTEVVCIQKVED